MKTSLVTVSMVAISSAIPSLHAEYSAEASLGYQNLDSNFSGEDLYLAGFSIYTSPLDYLGKTPYDEAAFFNQVGQVDLQYGLATGFGDDINTYGLAYTHQNRNSDHGFSASWFTTDVLDNFNAYEAGYHYFLDQGFSVGAEVALADFDSGHAWSYALNTKRLFSFENDRWLTLEGGFGWANDGSEGDWSMNVLATYYPTQRTGLGIGTTTTDRLSDYNTVFSATHYLKPNFAVNVSYNRDFIKNASDADGISFGGKLRF
ncbi:hypothetical protein QEH56_05840 [Pelagicoccus enzymogenes]|uniref:hypothetical protein n=1 Tax=Pelagicoccus enzymogenes TaxID=2773457 RepID=UPI00280F948F|nr:hypothetical protein [Pelagicoccus enzymogenes]MDQ8197660.1 hypothetical protein [Pelagicoccus enzymogenes]